MKRAVSNIAWGPDEDESVLAFLAEQHIDLEIAPTRYWVDPASVPLSEARALRGRLVDTGVRLVAFQSLLFARPDLTLFESKDDGRALLDYLARIIRLAGVAGATRLVFGSPRARRVPAGMTGEEALERASEFFLLAGDVAEGEGVVLCIEPNPPSYGCNFVTTAAEGADLVHRVDSAGFGLHLDAAGLVLAGDDPAAAAAAWGPLVRHVHASAPELGAIENEVVDHAAFASALRSSGYDGHVSIEMRAGEAGSNFARVAAAVALTAPYAPAASRAAVQVDDRTGS